jgi:HAMP domain-containing protein
MVMKESISASRAIQRKINAAVITISALGALATFLYFNVIAPLPQGQASLRTVGWLDLVVLLLFVGIPMGLGFAWSKRRDARIAAWHERLTRGASAAEVPVEVRRDVLNVPLRAAVLNASMWVLVGTVTSLLNRTFRFFVRFVGVGGLFTTVILFFVVDVLWRPVIPPFFPDGKLSAIGAFRLPVLGRLLVVFLLIGILPPAILVNLSWQRAQTLLAAPNPQAVLSNLLILQVFILATSILASVALAVFMTRSITGPLDTLQRAMKRVEQSDFDVRVPVTSDDELGYLSERLNEMAAGLREWELIKEAHRKVEQELAVAWTIQESFLPIRRFL